MKLRLLSVVFCSYFLAGSNVSAMCQCDNVNPAYVKLGEQILKLAAAKAYKIAFKQLQEQYPREFAQLVSVARSGQDFANTDLGQLLGDSVTLILQQCGLIGVDGKPGEALGAAIQLYVDVANNGPEATPRVRNAARAIEIGHATVIDQKDAQVALLKRIKTQRLSRANSINQ